MKRAIVTGASSGIGAAVARILLARQISTALFDLDLQGAEGIAAEAPELARVWPVDVTQEDQVARAVAACCEDGGEIEMLVNNVGGGGRGGPLLDMSLSRWEAMLALNLTSAFLMTREVGGVMRLRGKGAIVNIASLAASRVSPVGGAAYSAAKAGLVALTRQAAHELAPHGIRVNAVCPGPTRTALTVKSVRHDRDFPLGRWVEAEDVARAVWFLLSEDSSMTTGTTLDVDGGSSLD